MPALSAAIISHDITYAAVIPCLTLASPQASALSRENFESNGGPEAVVRFRNGVVRGTGYNLDPELELRQDSLAGTASRARQY